MKTCRSRRLGWRKQLALITATSLSCVACVLISPLDGIEPYEGSAQGGSGTGGAAGNGTPIPDAGEDASPVESGGGSGQGSGGAGAPDGGGLDSSTGGASNTECEENADCERVLAAPGRCVRTENRCIALAREPYCPLVEGDWRDPNAIFLGAFAALDERFWDQTPEIWNYYLALKELTGDGVGGLPVGPSGMRRPLVLITCNNNADRAVVDPEGAATDIDHAMEHLTQSVQVPAVVAALLPADLLRTFENYGQPNTFFLSPYPANATLASLPDSGLLWHMLGRPRDMALTYAALIERLEARIRAQRSLADGDRIKVALVTSSLAIDLELSDAAADEMTINGRTVLQNQMAGDVRYYSLDPADYATTKSDLLQSFRPDIIVSFVGSRFTNPFFIDLEQEWQGDPQPHVVFSPTNVTTLERDVEGLIGALDPGQEARFVGVNVAGSEDRDLFNEYRADLSREFPQSLTQTVETENFYDAFYFLSYAIAGIGQTSNVRGTDIEGGFKRLISGPLSLNVGGDDHGAVLSALATGGNISLQGTLGPPNFDPRTGVRVDTGSVFCFSRSSTSDIQTHFQVYQYDGELGELRASTLYPDGSPCQQDLVP